jgi:hypothetical protein
LMLRRHPYDTQEFSAKGVFIRILEVFEESPD